MYVLYATERAAVEACESTRSSPLHLDGRLLIVSRYKEQSKVMLPGTVLNCICLQLSSRMSKCARKYVFVRIASFTACLNCHGGAVVVFRKLGRTVLFFKSALN